MIVIDEYLALDDADRIEAAYGNTGLLIAETVTAGRMYGGQLWFGNPQNVGVRLREIAADVEVTVSVV